VLSGIVRRGATRATLLSRRILNRLEATKGDLQDGKSNFLGNSSLCLYWPLLTLCLVQGISRRPKGDKAASSQQATARGGASKPNIKKATFDTTKKKEVGVSDLTLLSKVSNEAINENLKKRFQAGEIYVWKSIRDDPISSLYTYC
jgi:hypothetical protein